MKRMLFVPAVILLMSAFAAAQTGAAGKWTGETQGRGGPQMITLELKVSGGTVSGTWTQGQQPATEISKGKVVDPNTITFSRSITGRGGDPITLNYTGKITGDELTLTVEAPAGGGGSGR